MLTEVQDLTQEEYEVIRRLVYSKSGINLGAEKIQLVRARLGKIVRSNGFESFREYIDVVERDASGARLGQLLDAITTNTTHLFREDRHFKFLGELIARWASDRAWYGRNSTLRIWSAGCSSGEEPYSIAMTADAALKAHPQIDLKILATDLSSQVLATAKAGKFDLHKVGTVPTDFQRRYLKKIRDNGRDYLQVADELRRKITFARFNLMSPTFPFKNGFHVIFCRNVMIYFDRKTQQSLVAKYARQLHQGGYLLIGHSESLSGIEHTLEYEEPTVYKKA